MRLRRRGIRATVPERRDQVAERKRRGSSGGRPAVFDKDDHKVRYAVSFVVVQNDGEEPDWFASVSLLDEGGYEVELRDARYREHELTIQHDLSRIAREVTIWLAARYGATPSRDF